jgi:hypothetical protein
VTKVPQELETPGAIGQVRADLTFESLEGVFGVLDVKWVGSESVKPTAPKSAEILAVLFLNR